MSLQLNIMVNMHKLTSKNNDNTRSPYEIARDLLTDVYNNAKLTPDGNLTLLPSTYREIKDFLLQIKDDRPTV